MSSIFSRSARILLAVIPCLIAGAAHAQQVKGSVIDVEFTNIVGDGVTVSQGGSLLTWGWPVDSSLKFTGESFNSNVGQAFSLGELRFQNGWNWTSENLEAATLGTTVQFTKPFNAVDTFRFDIDLQTNGSNPDSVGFELASLNKAYSIGNSGYALRLLGFWTGNGYASSFSVGENSAVSKDIYARLELAPVPEPGEYAVMGMAGLTVCGLMLRARRVRRNA